jgi:hypothetical protein
MPAAENRPTVQEPLREAFFRAIRVAVVVGTICVVVRHPGGLVSKHSLATWAITALLGLWVALAGHWVELLYLSWLRRHLGDSRSAHVVARLALWFLGGILLTEGWFSFAPWKQTSVCRPRVGGWVGLCSSRWNSSST